MWHALSKKFRESLSVRMFLLTFLMLLLASSITFQLIAWATPMTYVSVMGDAIDSEASKLVKALAHANYDNAMKMISDFSARTGAQVSVQTPSGEVITFSVQTAYAGLLTGVAYGAVTVDEVQDEPANASQSAAQPAAHSGVQSEQKSDVSVQGGTAAASQTEPQTAVAAAAATTQENVIVQADERFAIKEGLFYTFTVSDKEDEFTFSVEPSVQPVNQAVEALAKVAPWLLCVMLLFSVLCAFVYSRYISRPILRLSGISQKMAALDFGWEYAERREDEIGALGRNLNSLSRSLESALDELRGANAALERDIALERELEQQRLAFFSAASHELKTPVTILKGQLTGMLEGVDVYQDRDKYLARSLQVTGRMEHLVQELLMISRMEAADFAAQMHPLNLAQILDEQLPLYRELAGQKELTLQTNLPAALPITGDEALLRKALDSILSNAILYSPPGETVCVTAVQSDTETALIVDNGGVQLPQEAIPHLFEAFYRVEQSRNRSTGGSGLGLYLTARILTHHRADYAVENTQTGVRFTVRFPKDSQP